MIEIIELIFDILFIILSCIGLHVCGFILIDNLTEAINIRNNEKLQQLYYDLQEKEREECMARLDTLRIKVEIRIQDKQDIPLFYWKEGSIEKDMYLLNRINHAINWYPTTNNVRELEKEVNSNE